MNLPWTKINPLTPEMLQNSVTDLHNLHILNYAPISQEPVFSFHFIDISFLQVFQFRNP
jgi:hypothetical protein